MRLLFVLFALLAIAACAPSEPEQRLGTFSGRVVEWVNEPTIHDTATHMQYVYCTCVVVAKYRHGKWMLLRVQNNGVETDEVTYSGKWPEYAVHHLLPEPGGRRDVRGSSPDARATHHDSNGSEEIKERPEPPARTQPSNHRPQRIPRSLG